MNIYEIKYRIEKTGSMFFSRKTLQFFGQTLKSFKVWKIGDNLYKIEAPIIVDNKKIGNTVRIYDSVENTLKGVRNE